MLLNRKTSETTITTNNRVFTFLKPHDPEELVEEIFEQGLNDDEFLPYWADLWPSSEIAIKRLPELIGDKPLSICEIGCGLGDFSAILASYGHRVVATDYAEEGCIFTRHNAERNNVQVDVVAFDWRHNAFKEKFDIVVGVDILYELRWTEAVLTIVRELLKDTGRAYILDPNRQFLSNFMDAVPGYNLEIKQTIDDKTDAGVDVKIIEIVKGAE